MSPKVEDYLPLVRFLARKTFARIQRHARTLDVDDLFSAGCEGLLDAISKWDPDRENKFKTYAEFRIQGAMLDLIREMDPRGRSIGDRVKAYHKAVEQIQMRIGRPPATQELAEALDCPIEEIWVIELEAELHKDRFIDWHGESEKVDARLQLEIATQTDLDATLFSELVNEAIAEAMETISPRQRKVLKDYYWGEKSMKKIGRSQGCSESRVSQIHSEAIRKIEFNLRNSGIEFEEHANKPYKRKPKPKPEDEIPTLPIGNQPELNQ